MPSLELRLFAYWDEVLPPGYAATMDEMLEAMEISDPQAIRNALVRLRKGRVTDAAGKRLKAIPVRYHSGKKAYYNFAKVTPENVAENIPEHILSKQIDHILTRAFTLESAMGKDGLALSAQQLLGDNDLKNLISQLPIDLTWQVHGTFLRIAQARQLIALTDAKGQAKQLGSGKHKKAR